MRGVQGDREGEKKDREGDGEHESESEDEWHRECGRDRAHDVPDGESGYEVLPSVAIYSPSHQYKRTRVTCEEIDNRVFRN